jgi:hypothetical protein
MSVSSSSIRCRADLTLVRGMLKEKEKRRNKSFLGNNVNVTGQRKTYKKCFISLKEKYFFKSNIIIIYTLSI